MKKVIAFFSVLLLLSGCGENMMNNPTKKVEELLNNYQNLDNEVLADLDSLVAKEETFNTEEREKYKDLMKKHYQNLVYEIKDEEFDGDTATVIVEIEVTDYTKAINDANNYYANNQAEFNDESGVYDNHKFIDYQLEQLKKTTDKVKYTLEISLTKVNDEWQVDQLSEDDLDKINGVYVY